MFFWVFITALVCSSSIRAAPSISFFYPQTLTEGACTGANSWTKWFNTAKPSDNGNLDQELHTTIQARHGRDVCAKPQGMQAQSVGLSMSGQFSCSWSLMNGLVSGFKSNTPGLDFQVRFCCPNTDFITTTTTTTTPRPITSSTCGRASIKHSLKALRISGGSHAIPNSWPWQVFYEEKKPCGNNMMCSSVCGGTLIDARHVLTATHCIGTTNPATITIVAGLHQKNASEAHSRQIRAVQQIFNHPEYNTQSHANDITILRLAQPVQFNTYVQPACLPGPDPKPNANVVLTGWGALTIDGAPYHILKQAKVKIVGECNRYWQQVDNEKQICVGDAATGDSACRGDSGGPMVHEHNGQWVVSGVTSFGSATGCTTVGKSNPNVYTRVSYYMPWILSIIGK